MTDGSQVLNVSFLVLMSLLGHSMILIVSFPLIAMHFLPKPRQREHSTLRNTPQAVGEYALSFSNSPSLS